MSRICPCYSQMDSWADLQWDSASREGRSVLRCTLRRLVTYGRLLIMILCGTFPSSCNDTNTCSRIFTRNQLMHLLISGVGLIVLVLPFLCSRPVAHSIGVIPSSLTEIVGVGGAPQFASPDGLFHPPCAWASYFFFFERTPLLLLDTRIVCWIVHGGALADACAREDRIVSLLVALVFVAPRSVGWVAEIVSRRVRERHGFSPHLYRSQPERLLRELELNLEFTHRQKHKRVNYYLIPTLASGFDGSVALTYD